MKSLVSLSLLLLPLTASANDGAINIGLGAGAALPDRLEVLGPAPTFSPRVGYWFNETMLLEADLGFATGNTAIGTPDPFSYTALTPRVNMVGRVWADRPLNVLFVAGLGAWAKKINDNGELALPQGEGMDLDFLANAGPGLMVPIGDSFAVRTDLRWMLSLGSENWQNHGDAFMSWEWTGGLALMIGGTRDADKDGVSDDLEGTMADGTSCVDLPEDVDMWQDEDGCPDDDNDGDGILDADDTECPNDAEDPDEFEDEDGCPDLDNDGDGIEDTVDACPMVTGVESAKGCPDADGDGLTDQEDECERDAADENDVENAFGCPDGDDDGIPDWRDECPEEAGPEGGSPFRSNGCNTRVYPAEEGIVVTEPVVWSGSRGSWKSSSNLLVDEISEVIKGVQSYEKLEIRVYSEGEKGDETALKTAQMRANKVLELVVKDGAKEERLTAKGVDAPEVEGEGPHPNIFVAALEKKEIKALKRKYEDDKGSAPRRAPKKDEGDDGAEKKDEGEKGSAPRKAPEEKEEAKTEDAPKEGDKGSATRTKKDEGEAEAEKKEEAPAEGDKGSATRTKKDEGEAEKKDAEEAPAEGDKGSAPREKKEAPKEE